MADDFMDNRPDGQTRACVPARVVDMILPQVRAEA